MAATGVPFVKNLLRTAARSLGDKPGADQSRTRSLSACDWLGPHALRKIPPMRSRSADLMLMANSVFGLKWEIESSSREVRAEHSWGDYDLEGVTRQECLIVPLRLEVLRRSHATRKAQKAQLWSKPTREGGLAVVSLALYPVPSTDTQISLLFTVIPSHRQLLYRSCRYDGSSCHLPSNRHFDGNFCDLLSFVSIRFILY